LTPKLPAIGLRIAGRWPLKLQQKETPDATSVLTNWTLVDRSLYTSETFARKQRAAEALENAKSVLDRAKSALGTMIPTQRSFGETDEQFKARRDLCQAKQESLLATYVQDVESATKTFSDENNLYESCLSARRSLMGF
jgi:hypothetical protein